MRVCKAGWSSAWLLRHAVKGAQHQTVQAAANLRFLGTCVAQHSWLSWQTAVKAQSLQEHCNTLSAPSQSVSPLITHQRCIDGQGPGIEVQTAWHQTVCSMQPELPY